MLDWDDLHSFLAIARHGSLSAAARVLGVTQTTMGRRLDALHARAGARLLDRTPVGFVLTAAGERVLGNVERMEAEALAVERAVTGEDARIEGEVRITTVDTFGARVLTPILAELQALQPALSIELITDTRALSLSRREADIALRLAEFEQAETVVRRVGDMAFGLYAAQAYLDQRGTPDLAERAAGHAVVTLQADLALVPEARWLTQITGAAAVVLRSNSRDAHLQAALAGMGLACLPRYLGDGEATLARLDAPQPPVRGIWLGVHRDLRHTPRIRLVLDALTIGLKRAALRLAPGD